LLHLESIFVQPILIKKFSILHPLEEGDTMEVFIYLTSESAYPNALYPDQIFFIGGASYSYSEQDICFITLYLQGISSQHDYFLNIIIYLRKSYTNSVVKADFSVAMDRILSEFGLIISKKYFEVSLLIYISIF
jgi:hypothetical protein